MLSKDDPQAGRYVAECLAAGGVALIPTDTVYGLAVLPTFQDSIGRLYALKARPMNVNLPIMVSATHELESLGFDINESAHRVLRSPLVPGSLTVAMGFRTGRRPDWLRRREEAAVRIPDDPWLLSVLRETGALLVTSANAHGSDTPARFCDVLSQLHGDPDICVDGGTLHQIPSTLVNCRVTPPVVERIGAIPKEVVMEYLNR